MGEQAHLKMWFDSVDADRSGQINQAELQRALAAGNLHFPVTVVSQMIKLYDKDLSGTMSFDEFVSLHRLLVSMQDSFNRNLRPPSDHLVVNEVSNALRMAGYSLDHHALITVCQSFDKERLGRFRLDTYMYMCIFLQSAKNLFGAFDTSRTGRVALDFNQFVFCASNMRL